MKLLKAIGNSKVSRFQLFVSIVVLIVLIASVLVLIQQLEDIYIGLLISGVLINLAVVLHSIVKIKR